MSKNHTAPSAPGAFITLEGGEGTGKTTLTRCLGHELREQGYTVTVTREPGGTGLGEGVRDLLMQDFEPRMPAMSELLLFFAARAAHLENIVEPALARGEIVLCDRFTATSYAYQGIARGLGVDAVATLETLVQGRRRPDVTFVLDLPCEIGLARARECDANRFEDETLDFHEAARAGFQQMAQDNDTQHLIDATADLDTLLAKLRHTLAAYGVLRDQAA